LEKDEPMREGIYHEKYYLNKEEYLPKQPKGELVMATAEKLKRFRKNQHAKVLKKLQNHYVDKMVNEGQNSALRK